MRGTDLKADGPALAVRLAIGLLQGALLYGLFRAVETESWPAEQPLILAPVALVAFFVPIIGLIGWPSLRARTILPWAAAATAILAGIALHDVTWHGGEPEISERAFAVVFFSAVGLFIAQALIMAGDGERRIIASYPACFDAAWKLGVQAVMTVAFVAAFWIIVWLGSLLFGLIGLSIFGEAIGEPWFWIPATALAASAALHVTDVQPAIVRGIRTLKLTLLSWLLPILTGIVLVFLVSLPVAGLVPLWETKIGTPILLGVEVALILLINATYQDGSVEQRTPRLLRLAMAAAALALLPLAAISVYGLGMRVVQHGWTADRIWAAAAVAVIATYALGYSFAVIRSGLTLKQLEHTNIVAALATLGILLALFTPIADPARLAVASQVSRLKSGAVAWADFDLRHLRFDGGRYGRRALEQLKAEATDAGVIRDIDTALAAKSRYDVAGEEPARPPRPSDEALRANLTAHPTGTALPDDFPVSGWGMEIEHLNCLSKAGSGCDGFLVDLDGDGVPEIILVDQNAAGALAFTRRDGKWVIAGLIDGLATCRTALAALKEGKGLAAPSPWAELAVQEHRFTVSGPGRPSCF